MATEEYDDPDAIKFEDEDDEGVSWGNDTEADEEDEGVSWGNDTEADDESGEESGESSEEASEEVEEDDDEDSDEEDDEDEDAIKYEDDDEDSDEDPLGLTLSVEGETSGVESDLVSAIITADLNIDKGSYTIASGQAYVGDIIVSDPVKKARQRTYSGLTTSIKEMGVISPIHVLVTQGYADWLEEHGEDADEVYSEEKYLLVDGLRRLFAATKNRVEQVPVMVWSFKDPGYGREVALLLSMLLNKKQSHSWDETWNSLQVLEEAYEQLPPGRLEYLLGIEPGEAMKLKDVMGSQEDYPEIAQDLLDGKKNLAQAYNALQKLRKELSQWEREDSQGLGSVEEAQAITDDSEGAESISTDAVKELLDMADSEEALTKDDFDGELAEFGAQMQKPGERHILDPRVKAEVLTRDKYTCQACNFGHGVSSSIHLGTLEIHHLLPTYLNLADDAEIKSLDAPENLITTCSTCHKLIHLVSDSGCKLGMSQDEFEQLDEADQERWKKTLRYAKVIQEGENRTGYNRKKNPPKKLANTPFWELQKDNEDALLLAQSAPTASSYASSAPETLSRVEAEDDIVEGDPDAIDYGDDDDDEGVSWGNDDE